ncbi:MAG: GGDEF domain-containing protein [Salinarimonas sp.]|nr:GGDEF domain-containing protein [Salinarimonas sp.]
MVRSRKYYYLACIFHFVLAVIVAGALVLIETKKRELSELTYRDVAWSATNGRFEFSEMERNLVLFNLTDEVHYLEQGLLYREILRGRIRIWQRGDFAEMLRRRPDLLPDARLVRDAFEALDAQLDQIDQNEPRTAYRPIATALPIFDGMRPSVNALTSQTFTTSIQEVGALRDQIEGHEGILRWALIALVLVGGTQLVFVYQQNSSLAKAEQQARANLEQVSHLANHDALTGLPNRMYFETLIREIAGDRHRRRRGAAVFVIDLDRFKSVNDTLGHAAGDALLREVVRRVRPVLNEAAADHVFSRLGGDEFVALVPQIGGLDAATDLAVRIRNAIAEPFDLPDGRVTIDASVGVAMIPPDAPETVWLDADLALSEAKQNGRGGVHAFDPALRERAIRRNRIERELPEAVRKGQIQPHYQTQVSLEDGRLAHVEALARWRHPELGWITPGEFIPVAESSGQIGALGLHILEQACRDAHLALPGTVGVAVNLSVAQLRFASLPAEVAGILARTGLAPHRLTLEITESLLIKNFDSTAAVLDAVKALGVRIALDDFGAGFTAMNYLARDCFDQIKLDRSLIQGIASSPRKQTVVAGVVALSRRLGLEIVAEGIETPEDAMLLKTMGCDLGQGFLYSKAVPPEALDGAAAAPRTSAFARSA